MQSRWVCASLLTRGLAQALPSSESIFLKACNFGVQLQLHAFTSLGPGNALCNNIYTKHHLCVRSVLYLAVLLSGAVTTLGALFKPTILAEK